MEQSEVELFIESILPTVLEVGEFAIEQQGTVANLGKEIEHRSYDTAYVKEREQAKTVVDEQVQERLLSMAHKALAGRIIRIDAEEETPSLELFESQSADITLVIDPIDGTLQYLKGTKEYSVNLSLVSKGKVMMAIQYFPAHKVLYLLGADRKSYRCTCDANAIVERALVVPPTAKSDSNTIFAIHRVPHQERLSKFFTIVGDADGVVLWTTAFFRLLSGEYKAALFLRPQVTDVILGAIIEAMPGGYAMDFKGNKIIWPDGGRIQEVIFGFGQLPLEIKNCFANRNNRKNGLL